MGLASEVSELVETLAVECEAAAARILRFSDALATEDALLQGRAIPFLQALALVPPDAHTPQHTAEIREILTTVREIGYLRLSDTSGPSVTAAHARAARLADEMATRQAESDRLDREAGEQFPRIRFESPELDNILADLRETGDLRRSETRTDAQPVRPKVGRNDPCPCNSGRKSKKCHGSGAMAL